MQTNEPIRCAVYTRVSDDQRLKQDFNSLHAQYDPAAYIRSQAHAGWLLLLDRYNVITLAWGLWREITSGQKQSEQIIKQQAQLKDATQLA
jgi:hypothetical protein